MTDGAPAAEPASRPVARKPRPPRRRTPLIGPLFSWDLIRLARRGQDARSRTILALVLLFTLLIFTVLWFPNTNLHDLFFGTQELLTIEETSQFAQQFSLALLVAQMAVMVLLTPAYAAGAVAEEKERRTWQYLLSTDLSNREIVVGKFCSGVVFLLGVMLAGLPVLAITGLAGGIDPLFLGLAYLLTATTVALVASLGIIAAVYASTFRGAMFRAYGLAALYVFLGGGIYPLLSPIAVLIGLSYSRDDLRWFLTIAIGYMGIQIVLTIGFLFGAVRRIRRVERRAPRREMKRAPERPFIAQAVGTAAKKKEDDRWGESDDRTRRRHLSPAWAKKPKIGHKNPFVWKERYTLGTRRTVDDESIKSLGLVIGVIVAAFLGFVVFLSLLTALNRGSGNALTPMLIMAGLAGVFMHLVTLGPSACSAVLREKTRLTLESLLAIPVERAEILTPKWQVNFQRGWWWGGPGMICVVLGFLTSDISPVAFPTMIYLPGAAALCVSFGLWLSCRCNSIVKAVMYYLSLAGALTFWPLALRWAFDDRDPLTPAVLMLIAATVVCLAAWIFWRKSVSEFERYGRN